jgi:hypothetical protein
MTKMKINQQQDNPTLVHPSDRIPPEDLESLRRTFSAYHMESIYCYERCDSVDVLFSDVFIYQKTLDVLLERTRFKVNSFHVTKEGMLEIQFDLKK